MRIAASQDTLEDAFDLVAAMAAPRIDGTTETVPAKAVIANNRIGCWKRVGQLYLIPPILTSIIIHSLIVYTIRVWNVNLSGIKMEDT